MRLMNLITECRNYAILSHYNFWNSDDEGIRVDDLEKAQILKCSFDKSKLELRNGGIDASLLESFESACGGYDPRWRLIRVDIEDGELHLAFADTLIKEIEGTFAHYPVKVVKFCSGELLFNVEIVDDDGSMVERYEFEFWGDIATKSDDGYHIATIVENYKDKPSCYQYLYRSNSNKYYLHQEVYNS